LVIFIHASVCIILISFRLIFARPPDEFKHIIKRRRRKQQ